MPKKVLITGSAGLIGSQAASFFANHGMMIFGVDNNMRKYFFGEEGSTEWSRKKLQKTLKDKYKHYVVDIRDNDSIEKIFKKHTFDLIIHTAAQPSHDWAAREPYTDFGINATGTLYLLENFRKYCPNAVFIFTSTNKVYGDSPNKLPLIEKETRYELNKKHKYYKGISEDLSIDNSVHSIFGASKVAADIMVQEYGKYFKLRTVAFRGGCLTGPAHSSSQYHGFLAYLVKCIMTDTPYIIIGYKGKQVRDNIHSFDLVNAFYHFFKKPRFGEVYNIGGSRFSNTSIREAIETVEKLTGKKAKIKYVKKHRTGDHIWYISDVSKFESHFPQWKFTYDGYKILEDICTHGHFS